MYTTKWDRSAEKSGRVLAPGLAWNLPGNIIVMEKKNAMVQNGSSLNFCPHHWLEHPAHHPSSPTPGCPGHRSQNAPLLLPEAPASPSMTRRSGTSK